MKKRRLRNYGLWISIAALVIDILIYTGVITPSESETINLVVNRVLEILVLLGIINNPTKPDSPGYNL